LILISVAAAGLWLFLLSRLDRHHEDRGPATLVLFAGGGVASGVVAMLGYHLADAAGAFERLPDGTASNFVLHFLMVGPIEEISKFLVFLLMSSLLSSIREPRDGLLQAAAVGLGFASVENVGYGWQYGTELMFFRSVFGCLGHMVLASIWGSQWTLVYYEDRRFLGDLDFRRPVVALAVAAADHGVYNFMLDVAPAGSVLADAVTLIFAFATFVAFRGRSPYRRMGLWRWRQAIPELRRALRVHPASYHLRRKLGLYLLRAGQYREAVDELERCQAVRPVSAEIAWYRGIAMIAAGDAGRGRRLLSRAIERLPREHAFALSRSLRQLLPPLLRDRLVEETVVCGGPHPAWDPPPRRMRRQPG
jgi:protease PrsW